MRNEFQTQIVTELQRGRSVLIIGADGSGRSHTLRTVTGKLERTIYVPLIGGAKKQMLLDLAKKLHADEMMIGEALEQYTYYPDFEDVRKGLNRLGVKELTAALVPALKNYTLCIDELHVATEKAIKEVVLPLLRDGVTLLLAGDDSAPTREKRLNLVRNKCTQMELPALTKDEARVMLWSLLDKNKYSNWRMLEGKVLTVYAGKPGVVADLAVQMKGTGGSLEDIRNLSHTEARPINVTLPVFFVLLGTLAAQRYLQRGADDPTMLMLSGAAMVTLIVVPRLMFLMSKQ